MKQYSTEKIKNVALLGHASSGKTTLADSLLFSEKLTDRIGSTETGTTVMDFMSDEKKRGVSLSTAVYQFEKGENKINLIDAPGLFDFAAGVSEALTAADSAVVVLSGKSGVNVGSEQAVENIKKMGKACAFFVTKLNSSRAYFYRVLSTLTAHYGAAVCPVVIPFLEGDEVKCYINLIENKAYECHGTEIKECEKPQTDEIENLRSVMIEAVASADEALMEKYFEGEELSIEEITNGLKAGIKAGEIYPVVCGVGANGDAVKLSFDVLFEILPSADCGDVDPLGKPAALVFKTVADPFVGKLSYFKVLNGKIAADTKLINSRTESEEKLSKPMFLKGEKQEDTTEIVAGDIGCMSKLSAKTGDMLYTAGTPFEAVSAKFPTPCYSVAVFPKNKGEEEKIASGLIRLLEEDPTLSFATNTETKEQILSGLGEQHIDVTMAKLKAKFGVEAALKTPKVAYRETIKGKIKVQGRHKKQSGGHGQFGDVFIEFEPCDSDNLVFEEKIFGGAVPKNFFPAVEKGLRDCTSKGVLAGYPVVGVKATLVDGSYHPVDSSEMSFKMAAAIAFKTGIPQAKPVLLEPIGQLSLTIPDDIMGDAIGDINKRRGRVLGMNPAENHRQEIIAEVPMGEMGDFSTAMRSLAQGRATFSFEFSRYEEAPPMVANKVIAESTAE